MTTKVLIVDDDPAQVKILTAMLEDQGFEMSSASRGAEALQIAAADCPDVIVLDMMMPEMDGIEVCRRLKASAELRMIPVILVSAMDQDEDVVRGLDAGAVDYVTKPINPVVLAARLRSAMRLQSSYAAIARINGRLQAEIVERDRAEEALREREERFRNIVQNVSEVIYTLSPEGIVTFISPAWTATLGWDVAEIEGRSYLPFVHPDDLMECQRFLQRVLATGKAEQGFCYRIRHKDGSWRWARTALSVVKDKQGHPLYCVGVAEDITERRRVGEELQKKEEELRQSQKLEAVGLLAGGVAHEFNNLLQAIGGYAECACEGLAPQEQRYQDLQQIAKATERAAMLTRQLLGFSRRRVLQPKNVDPNGVVADLAKLLQPLIGEHIALTLALTKNVGAVYGDPGELQQVLLNLCLNARDAMPDGGQLVIKTDLVMLSEPFSDPRFQIQPGRHVVFGVTDTGCGIPPDVQQHMFEPFFTTKEVGKGTGLGLAMVYGLVQQHQGAIHVYSEPGKGTSFKIYLPAATNSAGSESVEEPQRAAGGRETILLAEDDPMVRRLALRILSAAGYQVLAAPDGAEALRVFAEHRQHISLVVMDAIMPKLTGHEVYRRIKAQDPSARVIFVSGYDRETAQSHFIFQENLPLLEKPFDADTLLRTVREALDEGQNV